MRGKAQELAAENQRKRITPAHAGKSYRQGNYSRGNQDHPRACGEKYSIDSSNAPFRGSPPRMRGKGPESSSHSAGGGITPAHAGKSPL